MFDLDKWREIWIAIKSNKIRTTLTAFGVFWGLFMLVVMLGAGNGLRNAVFNDWKHFHFNSVFMWSEKTSKPYKGFKEGRYFYFRIDDMDAIKANINGVDLLAPKIRAWGEGNNNVVRGDKTGAYNIMGDYPEANLLDPVKILKGRFINDLDIQLQRKVVIVGSKVISELFKPEENPIGQYIKIKNIYFQIIGVQESYKSGWNADRENKGIRMPLTTLQKTYNYGNVVYWFGMTSKPGYSVKEVSNEVMDLLKKRHNVAPDDDKAIENENVEEEFNKINGLFNGIDFLVWIVGIGTLLSGIIGISNIMLVVVRERTKEIGIKRAIGATPFKIISLIIMESVLITFVAGYVGLALGVGLLELVNTLMSAGGGGGGGHVMFLNPSIDFAVAFRALIIIVISGILAGLIPALRAVKIRPIEALKDE